MSGNNGTVSIDNNSLVLLGNGTVGVSLPYLNTALALPNVQAPPLAPPSLTNVPSFTWDDNAKILYTWSPGSGVWFIVGAILSGGFPSGNGPGQFIVTTGIEGVGAVISGNSPNGPVVLNANGTATGLQLSSDPAVPLGAATKQYVDNSAQNATAIQFIANKAQVNLLTLTALAANTYANGTAGVGATLTGNANGVLTIDGVAVTVGMRLGIFGEGPNTNNGIYSCTTAGTSSVPYVLTRTTDANTPTLLGLASTQVQQGTQFTGWGFLVSQTSSNIIIGTSPITAIVQPLSVASLAASVANAIKLAAFFGFTLTTLSGYVIAFTDASSPAKLLFGIKNTGEVVIGSIADVAGAIVGLGNAVVLDTTRPLGKYYFPFLDGSTPARDFAGFRRTDLHFESLGIDVTGAVQNLSPLLNIYATMAILAIGDSLTYGFDSSSPYPAQLQALTGRQVTNLGISGQFALQIAGRFGRGVGVTLSNNQMIVGSNTVTALDGHALVSMQSSPSASGQFLSSQANTAGATFKQAGTLEGVHGVMKNVTAAITGVDNYTFTPDTTGEFSAPVNCPANSLFYADTEFSTYAGETVFIWVGENDFDYLAPSVAQANVLSALSQMVALIPYPHKYFILSIPNLLNSFATNPSSVLGPNGITAAALYAAVIAGNQAIKLAYPRNYLPIREALVNGYNPTNPADVWCFQNDVPAFSLRPQVTGTFTADCPAGATTASLSASVSLETPILVTVGGVTEAILVGTGGVSPTGMTRGIGTGTQIAVTIPSGTVFTFCSDIIHISNLGDAIVANIGSNALTTKGF